jgi:hypothetical protein
LTVAKLEITGLERVYYREDIATSADHVFGDRYILRVIDRKFVIIDPKSGVKMTTNASSIGASSTATVVIYRPGDVYSRLERILLPSASSMYALPTADSRAVKKFTPLTDSLLMSLVRTYKAENPEAWDKFPRERLDDTLGEISDARKMAVGIFAFAFAICTFFTALSVHGIENPPESGQPGPLSSLFGSSEDD